MIERVLQEMRRRGFGRCPACEKPIRLGQEISRAHGRVFHRDCVEYRSRQRSEKIRPR